MQKATAWQLFLRGRADIWFVKQCWVSHSIQLWQLHTSSSTVWCWPEQITHCEAQTQAAREANTALICNTLHTYTHFPEKDMWKANRPFLFLLLLHCIRDINKKKSPGCSFSNTFLHLTLIAIFPYGSYFNPQPSNEGWIPFLNPSHESSSSFPPLCWSVIAC